MVSIASAPVDIDALRWPITVLGYGKRIGIWFQGCSIGCKGCCAKHTWERSGNLTTVSSVLGWIATRPLREIDGFTISGGEPFEQPEALTELLTALRTFDSIQTPRDVLVYSGFPWKRLERHFPHILALADVVISEPFQAQREPGFLRGSTNQRIHCLSDLAHARYSGLDGDSLAKLQIAMEGDDMHVIGIPQRGDIERLKKIAASRGLNLAG